ncbi:UV radiation resistance-associated protein [Halyomorpha halys]|uniref:UV radiation resistance-associated protein n=1 Tax=Halyomorpha halys TaxID=286706 RepID=UPI0006D4FDAF|nr:UV radiation resistance associated protein [Halyomorpha halys]
MSSVTERSVLRWKEWIPLVTQQQRLRNLIQVIAYNIHVKVEMMELKKTKKFYYYYTLHLTAMSSPLYTSEQLESENPKWAEIELNKLYGSANGVVIRLWVHIPDDVDSVITVWGIYFSGLVYIGPRLSCTDSSSFYPNSLILHMHGGYFTAPHCFLNPHPVTPRTLSIQLDAINVKPSYSVDLLLRLQSLQHSIKKESHETSVLQHQISEGLFASTHQNPGNTRGSATLRKLLSKKTPPKADPGQILAVKRELEMVRFKVKLLTEQRDLVQLALQKRLAERNSLLEKNQDRESELMENFCCLRRETEKKREMKAELSDCKAQLGQTTALLDLRRREIISELSYIYPIAQLSDGRYTIKDVYLPNSEDFEGKDELMISVALGFVAHLVQMISYFLDVPTRYPICHFGSRSKIIDHITDSIPDKEREFPLYSRGKEKHSFNYGVYLLNKNIAQLRWYCGLTTSDLRHTLPNLQGLMNLKRDDIGRNVQVNKSQRKAGLSCSLDHGLDNVDARQVNSDPQPYTLERRHQNEIIPPIHDLASLMLLDIPSHSKSSYNEEVTTSTSHLESIQGKNNDSQAVENNDSQVVENDGSQVAKNDDSQVENDHSQVENDSELKISEGDQNNCDDLEPKKITYLSRSHDDFSSLKQDTSVSHEI